MVDRERPGKQIGRPLGRPEGSASQPLGAFPGDEIEAVTRQVDDAGLHHCLREDSRDRVGEALQAVDDGDQYVSTPRFFSPS
jgi:hypothetical protein